MKLQRPFSSRGFSLMEVVIALGILSVAMMFSSSSVTLIGSNFQTTRRFAKAHSLAGVVMEELLSVYESDTKLTDGTHTQDFTEAGKKASATDVFLATWTVRTNFPITKVKEIKLDVSWQEVGKRRAVHYITYRGI